MIKRKEKEDRGYLKSIKSIIVACLVLTTNIWYIGVQRKYNVLRSVVSKSIYLPSLISLKSNIKTYLFNFLICLKIKKSIFSFNDSSSICSKIYRYSSYDFAKIKHHDDKIMQ